MLALAAAAVDDITVSYTAHTRDHAGTDHATFCNNRPHARILFITLAARPEWKAHSIDLMSDRLTVFFVCLFRRACTQSDSPGAAPMRPVSPRVDILVSGGP